MATVAALRALVKALKGEDLDGGEIHLVDEAAADPIVAQITTLALRQMQTGLVRTVLIDRYVLGTPHERIAVAQDLSVDDVKSLKAAGRVILRSILTRLLSQEIAALEAA